MTSAQVVKTSVDAITKSPSQDCTHLDDHNLPTYYFTILTFFYAYHVCLIASYFNCFFIFSILLYFVAVLCSILMESPYWLEIPLASAQKNIEKTVGKHNCSNSYRLRCFRTWSWRSRRGQVWIFHGSNQVRDLQKKHGRLYFYFQKIWFNLMYYFYDGQKCMVLFEPRILLTKNSSKQRKVEQNWELFLYQEYSV